MTDETCSVCGKPFSDDEWDARHTHPKDDSDVHERCCPECEAVTP